MQREGSVLFLSLLWLPPAAVPYPVSILSYYVIQSASFLLTWPSSNRRFINLLQVVTKFIMWLKMKRIWRSDRRLEWERWIHFSRSGFLALVTQEKFLFWPFLPSLIDQTCSVKVAWFCSPSFFFRFFNKLGQQSIYPKARDVCQVHISELGVSMSSTSHIIAHSILIGSRKIRSYVTCRLV